MRYNPKNVMLKLANELPKCTFHTSRRGVPMCLIIYGTFTYSICYFRRTNVFKCWYWADAVGMRVPNVVYTTFTTYAKVIEHFTD